MILATKDTTPPPYSTSFPKGQKAKEAKLEAENAKLKAEIEKLKAAAKEPEEAKAKDKKSNK